MTIQIPSASPIAGTPISQDDAEAVDLASARSADPTIADPWAATHAGGTDPLAGFGEMFGFHSEVRNRAGAAQGGPTLYSSKQGSGSDKTPSKSPQSETQPNAAESSGTPRDAANGVPVRGGGNPLRGQPTGQDPNTGANDPDRVQRRLDRVAADQQRAQRKADAERLSKEREAHAARKFAQANQQAVEAIKTMPAAGAKITTEQALKGMETQGWPTVASMNSQRHLQEWRDAGGVGNPPVVFRDGDQIRIDFRRMSPQEQQRFEKHVTGGKIVVGDPAVDVHAGTQPRVVGKPAVDVHAGTQPRVVGNPAVDVHAGTQPPVIGKPAVDVHASTQPRVVGDPAVDVHAGTQPRVVAPKGPAVGALDTTVPGTPRTAPKVPEAPKTTVNPVSVKVPVEVPPTLARGAAFAEVGVQVLNVLGGVKFAYDWAQLMEFRAGVRSGEWFSEFWTQVGALPDGVRVNLGDMSGTLDKSNGYVIHCDNGWTFAATYSSQSGWGMHIWGTDHGWPVEYFVSKNGIGQVA